MAARKTDDPKSKPRLILAFVLVCTLLILGDVATNLVDEIRSAATHSTLSREPEPSKPAAMPTLSEEEMQQWTRRLKTHSDT